MGGGEERFSFGGREGEPVRKSAVTCTNTVDQSAFQLAEDGMVDKNDVVHKI